MPANVENAIFYREAAWHREGTVSQEKLYAENVMELVPEIGSEVVKEPLFVPAQLGQVGWDEEVTGDFVWVPGKYATRRVLDGKVLGVVGAGYTVVQPQEAFAFLNALVDADEVMIESAISLRGGKTVILVARRPENILIAGEEHIPFLSFHNSFDGKSPLNMLATNVRIVCSNTEAMAFREAPHRYAVRHTSRALEKLMEAREALAISFKPGDMDAELAGLVREEALKALKVSKEYTEAVTNIGNTLAGQKVSPRFFDKILKDLVRVPPAKKNEKGVTTNASAITKALNYRMEIRNIYQTEENLNNIRGTRWGALQAVIQHQEHERAFSDSDRRVEAMLGGETLIPKALELLRN